jgi:hypothetical protein
MYDYIQKVLLVFFEDQAAIKQYKLGKTALRRKSKDNILAFFQ